MKIRCVACKELIYDCAAVGRDYAGAVVSAKDFVPLEPEVDPAPTQGQSMECPRCGAIFAARVGPGNAGGIVLLLEDGSWWPHPPIE